MEFKTEEQKTVYNYLIDRYSYTTEQAEKTVIKEAYIIFENIQAVTKHWENVRRFKTPKELVNNPVELWELDYEDEHDFLDIRPVEAFRYMENHQMWIDSLKYCLNNSRIIYLKG